MKTIDAAVGVALAEAALCVDCDCVFNVARRACPLCGGHVWMPLARFFVHRSSRVVPVDEVLHHAGSGLTPARVLAVKIAEALEGLLNANLSRHPFIDRVAAGHARRIVTAIDETITRLRSLGGGPDHSAAQDKESLDA